MTKSPAGAELLAYPIVIEQLFKNENGLPFYPIPVSRQATLRGAVPSRQIKLRIVRFRVYAKAHSLR